MAYLLHACSPVFNNNTVIEIWSLRFIWQISRLNSVEAFSAALQTTNHKIASDEQNCCAINYYHTVQVEYCHAKINIQRIGLKQRTNWQQQTRSYTRFWNLLKRRKEQQDTFCSRWSTLTIVVSRINVNDLTYLPVNTSSETSDVDYCQGLLWIRIIFQWFV